MKKLISYFLLMNSVASFASCYEEKPLVQAEELTLLQITKGAVGLDGELCEVTRFEVSMGKIKAEAKRIELSGTSVYQFAINNAVKEISESLEAGVKVYRLDGKRLV